jgi:ADP-ribosylglycohydrolase
MLSQPDDPVAFGNCLAGKLRLWLLGLPAGVGFATLRSTLKLCLGVPPARSGVFSAGNGPAMRSAIIGAFFFDNAPARAAFVSAATRLTHTDPRAETAAMAVAQAAAWGVLQEESPAHLIASLFELGRDEEWRSLCGKLDQSLSAEVSVRSFADSLGLTTGVSGYAYHSVPVALYAWLRSPANYREALISALDCGGDTDTVGAIVGALAGASATAQSIPVEWLRGIWEWPRSTRTLERAASALAEMKLGNRRPGPVKYFWPGIIPRNLLFLAVVLAHGLRRLVPP